MSHDSVITGSEDEVRARLLALNNEVSALEKLLGKTLWFGLDDVLPGQSIDNAFRIGQRIGTILKLVDGLVRDGLIPIDAIN